MGLQAGGHKGGVCQSEKTWIRASVPKDALVLIAYDYKLGVKRLPVSARTVPQDLANQAVEKEGHVLGFINDNQVRTGQVSPRRHVGAYDAG